MRRAGSGRCLVVSAQRRTVFVGPPQPGRRITLRTPVHVATNIISVPLSAIPVVGQGLGSSIRALTNTQKTDSGAPLATAPQAVAL